MYETLQNLADLVLDIVFLVKEGGEIVFVNPACTSTLGYEPVEMIGRNIRDFMHPEDVALTQAEMANIAKGRRGIGFENRYLRKDGQVVHLQWTAQWSHQYQLRVGVARDVSERIQAEKRQKTLLELSVAAHQAESLSSMLSSFHTILRQLLPVTGLTVALDPVDRGGSISADQNPTHEQNCLSFPIVGRGEVLGRLCLKTDCHHNLSSAEPDLLKFAASQAAAAIERFTLQNELLRAAQYDELTGLPNRRLFQDRIRSAIARVRRGAPGGAMLFIDLNDFKSVNDKYGHDAGDTLLRLVAERITGCVREVDTIARLGGDEFVAVLEDVTTRHHAEAIAEKIAEAISTPIELKHIEITASASIGVVLFPQQGTEVDQLLRHADSAMYVSKRLRKGYRHPIVDKIG